MGMSPNIIQSASEEYKSSHFATKKALQVPPMRTCLMSTTVMEDGRGPLQLGVNFSTTNEMQRLFDSH